MSALRSRLAEIERQMGWLESQLAVLRAERETVARGLQALVYPVLTLPDEILSEIFLQYVGDHSQYNPLRLTWVCRLWREVAICTHGLWTHFNNMGSVPLAALWFSRAGTLPLHLRFVLHFTPEKSQELLQVITTYASQWDTLALDTAVLPPNICFSFSRLTKLVLIPMSDGPSTLPALSNSLGLRELCVEGHGLIESPSAFPFAQLTELTLETDLDTCLELLARTCNVEHLDLFIDPMQQPPASLNPILLPGLRTLRLGVGTSHVVPYITTPALDNLALYIDDDDPPTMSTELADMIARSSCSIRTLELHLTFVSRESLNRFLGSVPLRAVRALIINGLDVRADDQILPDLFTGMNTYPSILPALDSFKIDNLRLQPGCRQLFARLLENTTKHQSEAGFKPLQMFSDAVLDAYENAKTREHHQIETKLKNLRKSLSQLRESYQVHDVYSGERIFVIPLSWSDAFFFQ